MDMTMPTFDFDEVLARAHQKMRGVEAAEMYMEYLQNDWVTTNLIPHCDMMVLHSPGACEHCDDAKPLQLYRKALGLKFTDELHENDALLPGESRTRASAEAWPRNR